MSDNKKVISFYYSMAVWGSNYIDLMNNFTLPSLFSKGNLPSLKNLKNSKFIIVTKKEDVKRITSSEAYKKLIQYIKVEIYTPKVLDLNSIPYYWKASISQKLVSQLAYDNDAHCIYLAPDFVFGKNALSNLYNKALEGKDFYLCSGLRIITENFSKHYSKKVKDLVLSIEPRELAKFALNNLHAEEWARFYSGANLVLNKKNVIFDLRTPVYYWGIDEQTILMRAFHLHPLMVKINKPKSLALLNKNTVDATFVSANSIDFNDVYISQDSDEMSLYSLTSKDDRNFFANIFNLKRDFSAIRNIAYGETTDYYHRHYINYPILIHGGECSKKVFAKHKKISSCEVDLALQVRIGIYTRPLLNFFIEKVKVFCRGLMVYLRAIKWTLVFIIRSIYFYIKADFKEANLSLIEAGKLIFNFTKFKIQRYIYIFNKTVLYPFNYNADLKTLISIISKKEYLIQKMSKRDE